MKRYRTKLRGKHTVLFRRWKDMQGRVRGYGTKYPYLYKGLPLAWSNFAEFRAFAVTHGFSKECSSPDRINTELGYTPDNVRFIDPHENARRALVGE